MDLPAQLEPAAAWRAIRAGLRRSLGDATFEIWIEPLQLQAWDGPQLTLTAPPATRAWVTKRFGAVIERCAREVVGADATVDFSPPGGGHASDRRRPQASIADTPPATLARTLNPRYSFEQFVIGDCNRLAHAAALAVAELPGQAYNPLFLHAPPGLGKTHLLHAIGNYVEHFGGGARVRYTTVEEFTNHFLASLASHSIEGFKRAYRDADVLLIDDVQFLASKVKTEEEFFHTFNALYENGRQLVVTADRLPSQLDGLSERLRERFEAGLVATLKPPEMATRLAILRKRAELDSIALEDNSVLELIAGRITDNVRALEGALIRIVAHHSLTGQPLDHRLATQILDEIHPLEAAATPRAGAAEQIVDAVCAFYELSPEELVSASRASRVSWPRQLAIFLTRQLTDRPLQEIGAGFGGRSHATVLHACSRVSERIAVDNAAAAELSELRAQLAGSAADRHS